MSKQAKPQNKTTETTAAPEGKTNYYTYLLAGIVVLTAILYSNCLHNDILNFDDVEYFNNYPEIRDLSWANVLKYFTNYYVIMYQPLPILTFAINYHFSGTDSLPLHLLNVCFHLANIILVYQFIKQLFDKKNIALIVALLFAVHPMNVEAVSWISARSSSMYTFFYLLALIQYVKYVRSEFKVKYILYAALFFILSLFSKTQAVTLPVVLFAVDYFLKRKFNWKSVAEKIPFFALSLIFGLITLADTGTKQNLTEGMLINYSVADIFFMLCYSFMFYFYKLLLPVSLCGIYAFPPKTGGMLPWIYYASPAVFAVVLYFIYRFRKNRLVVFGAALFFITISINIQVIPSRLFIVTDRYAYFPYIGLFLIIGYCYSQVMENAAWKQKYGNVFAGALAAWAVCFCYAVQDRNKTWADDLVFISDIIDKNPPVPYIARAYGNRGNYYLRNNMVQEALADFDKGIELRPHEGQTYYNRAVALLKINRPEDALRDLDTSIKYQPKNPYAYSNRAFIEFNKNDLDGAWQDCNACIKQSDKVPEAYNIRSAIEYMRKDFVNCEKDLDRTIALNPELSDAYKNRGILYSNTNRQKKACADWDKAASLGNQDAAGLLKANCH